MSLFMNQLADFVVRNSYNYSYSSSSNSGAEGAALIIMLLIYGVAILVSLAMSLIILVSLCKIAHKAGEPWWGMIIPFYSNYILCKITFGNGWLFLGYLLSFIPFIGYIAVMVLLIYQYYKLSVVFGRGIGTTLGLIFLPIIFFPILAFGSSRYDYSQADFFGKTF